ncbi:MULTISPECIES: hypothetical protein [Cupriavidus]
MQAQSKTQSVVLYSDTAGGWHFAEIDGKNVYRFGPFDSRKIVEDLIPVLFPELPVLDFPSPLTSADDETIMVLANGGLVSKISHEHAALAALRGSLVRVFSKFGGLVKPGIRATWNMDHQVRTTPGIAETGEHRQP